MSGHVTLVHGGALVCEHCHDRYSPTYPIHPEIFEAIADTFDKLHRDCQAGPSLPGPKTVQEWVRGDDVGNSSLTIYCVFQGPPGRDFTPSVPWDPDDFGRCHRLLALAPHWRANLFAVAHVWPEWDPLVERWDELERLYLEESPSGKCPKLYDLMQRLTRPERVVTP